MENNITRRALVSGAMAAIPFRIARADSYPDRPIRVLVPYPAGDGPDIITRSLSDLLYSRLHQALIVDNQPGAGTTVAAQSLKRSAPDGYTLMFGGSTTLAVAPAMYKNLGYDAVKDFTLVCTVAKSPFALLVGRDGPASLAELILEGEKPIRAGSSYGSAGSGSPHHLLASMLTRAAGISGVHVPYRGVTPRVERFGRRAYPGDLLPPRRRDWSAPERRRAGARRDA